MAASDINRLLPLLEMGFQAEQLKMAKIASRIAKLRRQLAEIDRPQSSDFMSPASRAGADLRWETWAHDRKTLINQELALALRDREMARDQMRKALSKFEAAKQVADRMRKSQAQVAARRASW